MKDIKIEVKILKWIDKQMWYPSHKFTNKEFQFAVLWNNMLNDMKGGFVKDFIEMKISRTRCPRCKQIKGIISGYGNVCVTEGCKYYLANVKYNI